MLNYAWNEEEARNALTEYGIELGIRQGMERGIQQGMERGIQQGMEDIAKSMLRDNLDFASITKYTHLSADRLAELAKEL